MWYDDHNAEKFTEKYAVSHRLFGALLMMFDGKKEEL
jgi:hypothetical protein